MAPVSPTFRCLSRLNLMHIPLKVNTIILGDERSSNFIKGVPFGVLPPGATALKTLYLINSGAPGDRMIDISVQSRTTHIITDSEDSELDDMTETTEMLVVPAVDPFKIVQRISYRQGLDSWSEYYPGDELSHVCRFALAPPEDDAAETPIPSPGNYRILWRRVQKGGTFGCLSSTSIPIPALQPPIEGLIALLRIPSLATLHVPIPLSLTVRNHHPTRSANIVVHLELDASDGFIVAGLRSGRLPLLMPGDEEKFTWKLIPIECGHVKIPQIKVVDKRPIFTGGTEPTADMVTKGEMVKIVDVRLAPSPTLTEGSSQPDLDLGDRIGTVLVLP
ncbi:hypothetical protein H0H87_004155 [Tephrocybe sp. NHM501043]|nr:hypothetical protein H0H87_004155 [Tephrocybe sp. NHM501043]